MELESLSSVGVSLLVENTARGAGFLGEHGLSWWLDTGSAHLLFDLGQGMVLEHNARHFGIDISTARAVVFSHGHYDHVGGWHKVAQALEGSTLHLHPDALQPKYQQKKGEMATAGDPAFARAIRSRKNKVVLSTEPGEVAPGIWVTGEIPRVTDYEDTGGDFFSGQNATEYDALLDDQSLFFQTPAGIVVILGCAHAGVINTLIHINNLTRQRIHALIGGMHLLHASELRIKRTLEALKTLNPDWIAPNHCTGDAALAKIREAFPGKVFEMHAGQTVRFPHLLAHTG